MSHVETRSDRATNNPEDPPEDPYEELASLFLTDAPDEADAVLHEFKPHVGVAVQAPIEVALVGHLPVMGGLWLTQYADQVGRMVGPTALVRIERGQVGIELLRAPGHRGGLDATDNFDDALHAVAAVARHWIVCPQGEASLDGPFSGDALSLLTGSDDAATVAAYRIVKNLAERWHTTGWPVPPVGLVVLGATKERAAQVADKLDRTTKAFLDVDLEVTAQHQRMDAIESAGRRTFPGLEMQVDEVCRRIHAAQASAPRTAARLAPPTVAKLGPKGIVHEPDEMPPLPGRTAEVHAEARVDSHAALLPGIDPLPIRCPMHRDVELAVDASGALQLVVTVDALASLRPVEAWAVAHGDLLRLACPRLASLERITTHVVTTDARTIIPLHGTGLMLHLLTRCGERNVHAPLS